MLLNGQQCDTVSLLDRGLHYGDGLFETIAVIDQEIPLWPRHYARLALGCERLGMAVPQEQMLKDEIDKEFHLHGDISGRHIVKLIITRGAAGRGYFPDAGEVQRIILIKESGGFSSQDRLHGIDIHLCQTSLASGSPLAGIKHLNRLEQVLAARETEAHGCREGLVCDSDGYITEGVMSNIFCVTQGELLTPSLDRCGVAGVMRAEVITQAGLLDIQCRQGRLTQTDVLEADALFLTNAVNGMIPVKRLLEREYNVKAIPKRLLDLINRKLMKYDA